MEPPIKQDLYNTQKDKCQEKFLKFLFLLKNGLNSMVYTPPSFRKGQSATGWQENNSGTEATE